MHPNRWEIWWGVVRVALTVFVVLMVLQMLAALFALLG